MFVEVLGNLPVLLAGARPRQAVGLRQAPRHFARFRIAIRLLTVSGSACGFAGTARIEARTPRLTSTPSAWPSEALTDTNDCPHAPARSRTWIYRLGGGRLIHWTTRARERPPKAIDRPRRRLVQPAPSSDLPP